MTGWAPETEQLSRDLLMRLRADLSRRKPRSAFVEDAQERFFRAIASAITHFHRTSNQATIDRDMRVARIDRLAESADDLLKAHRALDADDSEVFGDMVSYDFTTPPPSVAELLASIARSAAHLSASHRRQRGVHEVVSGPTKFMVFQIASAWHDCFGRPATTAGAFAGVISEVISELGGRPLGRDALRSILDHRG